MKFKIDSKRIKFEVGSFKQIRIWEPASYSGSLLQKILAFGPRLFPWVISEQNFERPGLAKTKAHHDSSK
jgi:hypothetical protein